jgi:hypothetical protein
MIGYWHASPCDEDRHVAVSLGAHVGGWELVVERCDGEPCWHWKVTNHRGRVIEEGVAPDPETAERLAEDAAFHIHPPSIGDWVARLI